MDGGGSALDAVAGRTPALAAVPVQQRRAPHAAQARPTRPLRRTRRHIAARTDRHREHLRAGRSGSTTTRPASWTPSPIPMPPRRLRALTCGSGRARSSPLLRERRHGRPFLSACDGPPRRGHHRRPQRPSRRGRLAAADGPGRLCGRDRRRRRPDGRPAGRRRRVIGAISGLREPVLAEPEVSPEIDIPLWKFLSDNAPTGCCPVPGYSGRSGSGSAVQPGVHRRGAARGQCPDTRGTPLAQPADHHRWTPLRRFWQRVNVAAGEPATDIRPVVALNTDLPLWPDGSPLGDVSHLADPAHGANMVVVLHTELFRRYPATLIYLVANTGGVEPWRARRRWTTTPSRATPAGPGVSIVQRHSHPRSGVLRIRGTRRPG